MTDQPQASQYISKRRISVWTLPQGSQPAVRVEVSQLSITASRLLRTVFDTLGIHEQSRPFFGLFKGLDPPTKKFGDEEIIHTPCRSVISIQKWSFDPVEEARAIKTDTASIRLLALQIKADIIAKRFTPSLEDREQLEQLLEPKFPCYKQYVDLARGHSCYGTVVVKDVKLMKNLRLQTQTLRRGHRIDIACNRTKMVIITETKELHIPWRKVRRWTQINDNASLGYEIYLMEEKAFTWIEVETVQAPYLLQVTSELVGKLNDRLQKVNQNRSDWAEKSGPRKKLTWSLFKREMFGGNKDVNQEPSFYNIEDAESSSDENEADKDKPQAMPLHLSKKAGAYLAQ